MSDIRLLFGITLSLARFSLALSSWISDTVEAEAQDSLNLSQRTLELPRALSISLSLSRSLSEDCSMSPNDPEIGW